MDSTAKLTSKGQVTIPKSVRDTLGLREGDNVLFRVDGGRAVIAKTPDLLELAGSVPVPVNRRGAPWDDVLRRTRAARVEKR
jgi:AbrB family looped-hinge helix DNA binding protein